MGEGDKLPVVWCAPLDSGETLGAPLDSGETLGAPLDSGETLGAPLDSGETLGVGVVLNILLSGILLETVFGLNCVFVVERNTSLPPASFVLEMGPMVVRLAVPRDVVDDTTWPSLSAKSAGAVNDPEAPDCLVALVDTDTDVTPAVKHQANDLPKRLMDVFTANIDLSQERRCTSYCLHARHVYRHVCNNK